ncbi:hypothetical protein LZ30DRAFT_401728 [Colletotrichum cereale]|nr:hypothetical protein LZ30DRAFT_401728 [Colletotrichum cereale]
MKLCFSTQKKKKLCYPCWTPMKREVTSWTRGFGVWELGRFRRAGTQFPRCPDQVPKPEQGLTGIGTRTDGHLVWRLSCSASAEPYVSLQSTVAKLEVKLPVVFHVVSRLYSRGPPPLDSCPVEDDSLVLELRSRPSSNRPRRACLIMMAQITNHKSWISTTTWTIPVAHIAEAELTLD